MMRYTTEQLTHEAPQVGSSERAERFGGCINETDKDVDHAVIDNEAHPLAKVVCYATQQNAKLIAEALNTGNT